MATGSAFQNLATGLLCICAVVVTTLVIRRELEQAPRVVELQNWRALTTDAPVIGEPQASISVVLFSDFQCPACARANEVLVSLRRIHPSQFAVFFRHYPLSETHPDALVAAIAAECAGRQNHFEEFHDVLFARQHEIGITQWDDLAADANIDDVTAFTACLGSPAAVARVRRDIAVGDSVGIDAVPAFVVDGRLSIGSAGIRHLQSLLATES